MAFDSPTRIRETLHELGIQPRKKLGQNFLCDRNWIEKIVSNLTTESPLVEIGPGLGSLTLAAHDLGSTIHAIEVDPILCNHLRAILPGQRFHLVEGDAVEHPTAQVDNAEKPFQLLSNLPFAITSPWFGELLVSGQPLPKTLFLILQKEGFERVNADVGDKGYGPVAIRMSLAYKCCEQHRIPKTSFYPQPGVDSVFAIWHLRENPRLLTRHQANLLRDLFQNRRKILRHAFRKFVAPDKRHDWEEHLSTHSFSETNRAEEIPPEVWWNLLQ
ncbi:MAG: 16S rRNA (adenine(1518)-N(6)/adenine(1519)-N(6))-dimethyltransferase RsmA [Verrucomicrobiota bacterium]